ncbi:MAG: inositol 2-dehydrogenase [Oscillospiraceae bacterium]|jgi:myo-inositol 2-dehydrogenase/D-chiro-inositol 1-dehydrogenase|nr:inositol 2-dehydrogenase [Oscillospiraceae bacterium]
MGDFRIGVIGAGRIGAAHARSITYNIPRASVAAVSDPVVERARTLAAELGIPAAAADYDDILSDRSIDAVFVCSPTDTHAGVCIEAARVGKHIFCEKPVDLTIEKILAVKDAAERAGVQLQVGFNRRFDHNHARVRGLVAGGAIGKVEIVKITSRDPAPPSPEYAASSGGLFIDMMIHDFDMASFQAGSPIVEVYAQGASLVDPAIGRAGDVDTAIVMLKFESGALGVIDNSRRAAYGYDQRVEVFGEKGMAASGNDTDTSVSLSVGSGVITDKPRYFFLERYMASFTEEARQFVEACVTGKPVPVNVDDALLPVIAAKAAKLSLDERRPARCAEIWKP